LTAAPKKLIGFAHPVHQLLHDYSGVSVVEKKDLLDVSTVKECGC
jgi:hypothetical protein